MRKSVWRWCLTSAPVRWIHGLSSWFHDAYFVEFDPFNDAGARRPQA